MPPAEVRTERLTSLAAVLIAGACTFLNVYVTQPLLPSFERLFGASEVAVSLTVSATTLGIAVAAPLVGLLAERIGRKRVIVPALFALSAPTLLAATSRSLHALIFWRFLQGVFVPGIIAVMMAYINEEWEGSSVASWMSAYVAGTVFGGFLGRFVTGLVATHISWRYSFVVIGGLTLLGGIAVRAWLPKAAHFQKSESFAHATREGLQHLRNPRLLANFAMGFAVLFSLVGTFTYVNFYLAEPPFLLNAAELGSVFFVYLLGVVVTPMAGRFQDRRGFRATSLIALALSLVGLALTLSPSLPLIISGLALFSTAVFIWQSAATTQTGKVAGRARSSAAGLYVTFYYIGGSVGAVVPAWFWSRYGWRGVVAVLALSACSTVIFGFASGIKLATAEEAPLGLQ